MTEVKPLRLVGWQLQPNSLVGSYFHSGWVLGWQGRVVAEVAPTVYLVETFSWIDGSAYNQTLIKLEDMDDWVFYDDVDWMTDAYTTTVRERWARRRREVEGKTGDDSGDLDEIAASVKTRDEL